MMDSGRDTKYFLEQGYQVEAIDGSEELCKVASAYTGITVKKLLFIDLSEVQKYDTITKYVENKQIFFGGKYQ